ncbi:hypothetical protein F2Q68_00028917 [Brassica cretica]|uniref:E3 ubiquitin-protein ligase MARCHF6-like C-terminal domain-containing protein n=1 Tax=Brassica cretica TaxID=69181 RepID=A0A8S9G6A3_BRACR|nr:hypothetical protein F2Q68_00028917 [Brassica cretica]
MSIPCRCSSKRDKDSGTDHPSAPPLLYTKILHINGNDDAKNLLGSVSLQENLEHEKDAKRKNKKTGIMEDESVDWESLRKIYTKEGFRDTIHMDTVDWNAVRLSDQQVLADTIMKRGQHNGLARKILKFLNDEAKQNGIVDLEWLRDAPSDLVKRYLLEIEGIGLKSAECVRLLGLKHSAFPVDTNVGRIAVRLGWVPLEPLPDGVQLHQLFQYPSMDSIQKYLWPRLCKLPQETLYELHYQMITFGKVFCTKVIPNCNACPMKSECKYFASAYVRYNFVIRIILLLLYAWVTLLLFNSALIVVPVSLGRALFSAIPVLPITHGIKCNDLYAFVIGTYAFWTAISGGRYAIEHVKSRRTSVLLNQIWKWCGIVFKSSVLLAIWVFIIPVLIGLLFELLVIVPMRVPVDESPVFLLYQDWALGLIFLKIWTRLVMLDHMLPIMDDSWRAKFERVREDGFSRLQGLWVLREIVFPIVMKLLTALCVPYVLARGVFPMLGYPLVVNSAVYRFAWIGCLSVSLFCFCAKRCHVWFRNLHNSIRDDRYLIGRRLHNFGEAALANQSLNQSSEDAGGDGGVLIGREGDADTGLRLRRAIQQEA